MTEKAAEKPVEAKAAPMKWVDFLVTYPPDAPPILVAGALDVRASRTRSIEGESHIDYQFTAKDVDLSLYCDAARCGGERLFERRALEDVGSIGGRHCFALRYACRNCTSTSRLFVVLLKPTDPPSILSEGVKLGEWPPFGQRVPDRAINLIAADRELFFQGRKAENRGLGIGALTYYRRVLDQQRVRIVGEILKAAQKLGAKPDLIRQLEEARDSSWRFTDSVDKFKAAMPETLLVAGQNPLLLLHNATSEGIHELSDQECLTRASAIRQVLTELAIRTEEALKEREELHGAVKVLIDARRRAETTEPTTGGPADPRPKS